MIFNRSLAGLALLALSIPFVAASADPIDLDGQTSTADCYNYTWGDPPTNYSARDDENQHCMTQRTQDRVVQPLQAATVASYAQDPYRDPASVNGLLHLNGVRFRYETQMIPGLTTPVEIYRPCRSASTGDCPALPSGLARFDPAYPVVVTMHGFISQHAFQWWAAQSLAESGYLVVNIDTGLTGPTTTHSQAVLDWLTGETNPYKGQMDLNRIGISGHSQGGGVTFNTMRADARITAAVDEDDYFGTTSATDTYKPTLFIFADSPDFPGGNAHAYATPPTNAEAMRGDSGKYDVVKGQGIDVMKLVTRATTHVDWVGNGGTGGNRYWEGVTVYYMTAWFDRYLKGKDIASESSEQRAAAKDIADAAYARLVATNFDGSQDVHNISMGWWDPIKAAAALDPLYGGNAPYVIGEQPVRNRLSFYWNSDCSLTRPDGSRVEATNIRMNGCS